MSFLPVMLPVFTTRVARRSLQPPVEGLAGTPQEPRKPLDIKVGHLQIVESLLELPPGPQLRNGASRLKPEATRKGGRREVNRIREIREV